MLEKSHKDQLEQNFGDLMPILETRKIKFDLNDNIEDLIAKIRTTKLSEASKEKIITELEQAIFPFLDDLKEKPLYLRGDYLSNERVHSLAVQNEVLSAVRLNNLPALNSQSKLKLLHNIVLEIYLRRFVAQNYAISQKDSSRLPYLIYGYGKNYHPSSTEVEDSLFVGSTDDIGRDFKLLDFIPIVNIPIVDQPLSQAGNSYTPQETERQKKLYQSFPQNYELLSINLAKTDLYLEQLILAYQIVRDISSQEPYRSLY